MKNNASLYGNDSEGYTLVIESFADVFNDLSGAHFRDYNAAKAILDAINSYKVDNEKATR